MTTQKTFRYIARTSHDGCRVALSAVLPLPGNAHGFAAPEGWTDRMGCWQWNGSCSSCGRAVRLTAKMVLGKVNHRVPCNAKCTEAVGHQCECSCGGRNHGAGHEVAA